MTGNAAFIGGGTMASAILASAVEMRIWSPEQISVADIDEATRRRHNGLGHITFPSPEDLPESSAYFLCVKPQDMAEACASLAKGRSLDGKAVVSIAAGVSVATLNRLLGGSQVIRTMPNTPILVGQGCTFAYGPDGQDSEAALLARKLFSAMGKYYWVEQESLIDAATALSGSGPAYAYLVIEAMANNAAKMGLDADVSLEAAVATVQGACAMIASSSEIPSSLRAKVTSKGGTTEAALRTLSEMGFEDALGEAMIAAQKRAEELSG